jgi:hypothetical protein
MYVWPEYGDPEKFTINISMGAVHLESSTVASLVAINDEGISLSLSHQVWSNLHWEQLDGPVTGNR